MGHSLIGCTGNGLNPGVGSFVTLGQSGLNTTITAEANAQLPIPFAGTLSNFFGNAHGAGTNLTCVVRKGGVTGNSTVTPANGKATDTTHTDHFNAGDLLDVDFTAKTGSPTASGLAAAFLADSTHTALWYAGQSISAAIAGQTNFFMLGGQCDSTTTEANAQMSLRAGGTLSHMALTLTANSTTTTLTVISRIGGANGNLTFTVGAGLTGLFQDTTHSDTVSSGNLVDLQISGGTSGSYTIGLFGVAFQNTGTASNDVWSGTNGNTQNFNVINRFPIIGSLQPNTESFQQVPHGFPVSTSNLRLNVSANSLSGGGATIALKANSASVNQGFVIGAGLTGLFEDTTHNDSFLSTDLVAWQADTTLPTSGSITFLYSGLLEADATPIQGLNYDWPNPRLAIPPIANRTFIQEVQQQLIGKDTFFDGPGRAPVYDYPNPRNWPPRQDYNQFQIPQGTPLQPYDYPNPRGPVPIRQDFNQGQIPPGTPLLPYDYPNPRNPVPIRQWWSAFTIPPGTPVTPYDYPNPRLAPTFRQDSPYSKSTYAITTTVTGSTLPFMGVG